MNAQECWDIIQQIAAQPGRNEKTELLRRLLETEFGKWLIRVTYDPFMTWGVKPKDLKLGTPGQRSFDMVNIDRGLRMLANRSLSGSIAKAAVLDEFQTLDEAGQQLFWRIMSKDLKAGVGIATIEMAAPGLIPSFAVMRAQTYEPGIVKDWPRKLEFKLDGQRNTFICRAGAGAFYTRSGKHVPALDFFVPNLLRVGQIAAGQPELTSTLVDQEGGLSFVLDGEAMMGLFADTGALRRKDTDAIGSELHLYDILSYADFDSSGSAGPTLIERRSSLDVFVDIAKTVLRKTETPDMIQKVPQYFVHNDEEVRQMFDLARSTTLARYLARGDADRERDLLEATIDKATGLPKVLEGVMVKDPNGQYEKRKSRGWLKVKAEETEDLCIIGAFPGDPGTKYEKCLGGVIVDRNGVQVRVGGGFSDEERLGLWELYQADLYYFDAVNIEQANRGSGHVISSGNDLTGLGLLGRLIEVEFHEVTPDGSLRHPRYIRFRDDKDGEREAA